MVIKDYREYVFIDLTLISKVLFLSLYNFVYLFVYCLIHFCFFLLQNENRLLYTHRSTMLRLNAAVHSWLTRQEQKQAAAAANATQQKQIETVTTTVIEQTHQVVRDENGNAIVDQVIDESEPKTLTQINVKEITSQGTDTNEFFVDDEFHKQLKDEVSEMYTVWGHAEDR